MTFVMLFFFRPCYRHANGQIRPLFVLIGHWQRSPPGLHYLKRGCKGRSPCRGVWGVSPRIFFLLLRVSPQAKRAKEAAERTCPRKNQPLKSP